MGTLGANAPTVAANDGTVGTVVFTDTSNILTSDDSRASAILLLGEQSQYLKATGFQFSIPLDATINGILVEWERSGTVLSAGIDAACRLVKAGVPVGNDRSAGGNWPTTDAFQSYGGAADLWGTTWTPAEISAVGFGAALSCSAVLALTAGVDSVRITVYYAGSNRAAFSKEMFKVGDGTWCSN